MESLECLVKNDNCCDFHHEALVMVEKILNIDIRMQTQDWHCLYGDIHML